MTSQQKPAKFLKLDNIELKTSTEEGEIESNSAPLEKPYISVEMNGPFEDRPKWIGNCFAFGYNGYNPLFVIGPNWQFYLITNIFIIGFSFAVIVSVISKISLAGALGGFFLVLIQATCYMLVSFLNPGIPDRSLSKFGTARKINKEY